MDLTDLLFRMHFYTNNSLSNLIWTCVHVDEAVMGLSVHADGDGEGDNPLLTY